MPHPTRAAFCPIFFGANGGKFTPDTHLPIMRKGIRGLCNRPWDCGACSLLREWIDAKQREGWVVGWECDDCLKRTRKWDDTDGGGRELPGFYQAGRLPRPKDDPEYDKDKPKLEGCTRCGYETSFLQLVLRRTLY